MASKIKYLIGRHLGDIYIGKERWDNPEGWVGKIKYISRKTFYKIKKNIKTESGYNNFDNVSKLKNEWWYLDI